VELASAALLSVAQEEQQVSVAQELRERQAQQVSAARQLRERQVQQPLRA
jgi:hypothetical protein